MGLKFTTVSDLRSKIEQLEPLEVLPQVLPQVAEEATKWFLYNSNRRLERTFINTTLKDIPFTTEMGNVFTTQTPLMLQRTLDRFLFRLDIGTPFFGSALAETWASQRATQADGTPCGLPLLLDVHSVAGIEGLDVHHTLDLFSPELDAPIAVIMPGAGMRIEGTLEDARGREFVSQIHGLGFEHIIMVNLPGFSNNAGSANQANLQATAKALEAFLREKGIAHRAVLFGYSTSNYVANAMLAYNQAFCKQNPKLAPFSQINICFEFAAFTTLPKTVLHHVFYAPNPNYSLMEQWVIGRFLPLLERSGSFNNLPLLSRIHPETELHFFVNETDEVTPVYMGERLFKACREEGIASSSLTVLPKAPADIDAHAEGVLEGVLHGQNRIAEVVQRHYKTFKAKTLIPYKRASYIGAKPYGKPAHDALTKKALPKSFEALVDVPSLD
ncbi:MAG: hypothetical protein LW809_05540 [Vampirovibrionales bacterium]|jgi:hypothetical protein|nr:hypothetical protein [Vampirovibrionales bacterium]